ncbi:hypothetical protein [Hymenobacter daeguensis]
MAGVLGVSLASGLPGQAQQPAAVGAAEKWPALSPRLPYHILREQEDFGFLQPDSLRAHPVAPDFFDPLKYVPLRKRPGHFLTVGLDVRYQYEVIKTITGEPARPPTRR